MNMKLILLFVAIVGVSFGQTKTKQAKGAPSKLETQEWIKQRIEQNSFNPADGEIKNKHIVKFDQANMIIINEFWASWREKTTIEENHFVIKEIDSISIVEKEFNVWLVIYLVPGAKESVSIDKEVDQGNGTIEVLLNKDFLKDNIPTRMKNAFARLIAIYGGKKQKKVEPF